MAKSHQYIIQVLPILDTNIDNKKPDKPAILEEVINRHDWLKRKKAMDTKYNSFIRNNI